MFQTRAPANGSRVGKGIFIIEEVSIFYVGVLEIERFRKNRSKYNLNKRLLYCENVIINLPSKFKHIDGSELFAWPHYLLKLLYTQVGIMLGKFWVNEKLISKKGISIPSPPCHFLSIRSTIKSRDPGLLKKTKNFSLILQQSEEKGQNVHHLLPKECELNIQSMKKYNYYQCVLNWGKRRVE